MPYRLSNCVCLTTPDLAKASEFYTKIIGLQVSGKINDGLEFEVGSLRFFVNPGGPPTLAMEFVVPNLEKAREELVAAGCEVVKWEGKGRDCYIRDPFGLLFNLWEDPRAF
ncbi:MAG: VOC family protein [bacterium]